ncbi:type II toxin-antitoxin system VapC family toxin [Palleronia marisminoris]|uniref:type II toxin-antitoxin system VapC family toxin n=1 Tax=Palleronia marisminoris TaxID=315423 RepID=UPI0015935D43|nr:PIN domain-containing protein [Palleronia marisminoris]
MAKPEKFYWDTCAFIGLLNGEESKKRELEIVYSWARDGKAEIWTSTLSMIECRRLSSEKHEPKPLSVAGGKKISDIFRQPFIKPIPLAVDIADTARELWRKTPKLTKYPDAVHLASALRWSVRIMHTYDRDDLLHLSEKLVCRDGYPLLICYPDHSTDGALFEHAKQKPASRN